MCFVIERLFLSASALIRSNANEIEQFECLVQPLDIISQNNKKLASLSQDLSDDYFNFFKQKKNK